MVVALTGRQKNGTLPRKGMKEMKEVADDFAKLAAIVMILITIAISTAAFAQWSAAESNAQDGAAQTAASDIARAQ